MFQGLACYYGRLLRFVFVSLSAFIPSPVFFLPQAIFEYIPGGIALPLGVRKLAGFILG